jgi:hypothetical protein
MSEFNLVLLKIGYYSFYCLADKAMEILMCLSQANLLQIDENYNKSKKTETAQPISDGFISVHMANPARAFMLIRAGEEHMENKE